MIYYKYNMLPNDFNCSAYRHLNKDLSYMNDDELKHHFLDYGKNELRKYKLQDDFDINAYRELNSDLQNLNDDKLISHFINHGIKENRRYKYLKKEINNIINDFSKDKINLGVNHGSLHGLSHGLSHASSHASSTDNTTVFVVARYNEDISRFAEFNNNLVVYNKGKDDISPLIDRKNIRNVPNLGREAGTYCNYILDNYNNLPPYMIFTQGDPSDHIALNDQVETTRVLRNIYYENKTYKFKYLSGHKEPIDLESVAHFGQSICCTPIELGDPKNVFELIDNIKHWVKVCCPAQEERSNELINELHNFMSINKISTIWPWEFHNLFLKTGWYCTSGEAQLMRFEIMKNNFDYSKIKPLFDRPGGFSFGYGAIFIVHRDNILKYSRQYWQRLFDSLQYVLPGPGWGCERLWGFLLGEGDFYVR